MRSSREEIDELLARTDSPGSFQTTKFGTRTIAWIEAGDPSGPLVVFVHGSPGSLDAFAGFFQDRDLLARARLVSVDRPGFGYSGLGEPELSLACQADAVAAVIEALHAGPAILIGHSYGGPVVARVAIDHRDLVAGLVLVAASIDPGLEPKHWFQKPLANPALRWLVPRPLRASNEEILALEPELRAMIPMWKSVRAPVTVIQGEEDTLVPPANADFAKRMMVNTDVKIVRVPNMNHFVPWNHPALIHDAIVSILDHEASPAPAVSAR